MGDLQNICSECIKIDYIKTRFYNTVHNIVVKDFFNLFDHCFLFQILIFNLIFAVQKQFKKPFMYMSSLNGFEEKVNYILKNSE